MTEERLMTLSQELARLGAAGTAVVPVSALRFDLSFRRVCETGACGMYGRCWTCPPEIGEAEALIAQAKTYRRALVYRTTGVLEDSFDIEGMLAAGEAHNRLAQELRRRTAGERVLHLGAGGCRRCPLCAKVEGKPCRHPAEAMASLEGYCVDVTALAAACGMPYHAGAGTVTYFGAMLA